MSQVSHYSRMLIGRLLTRSGDQAWDFAVPIVLLQIFPGELRIAALYYLLVRVAIVLFLPRLSQLIDQMDRLKAARLGILLQLVGVILGFSCILALSAVSSHSFLSIEFSLAFTLLIVSGIVSQLGSTFMDISVANDLVPSVFKGDQLTKFNSHLRQMDLFTEVVSPVVAGALLLMSSERWPLFGFSLIALWNVISFFPEYGLLKSIFVDRPDLKNKSFSLDKLKTQNIVSNLRRGWRSFWKEPVAMVVLAYSFLWLSVLSPHGVLLTAYLKDGWRLPELTIGIFRGAGALFGLFATLIFPVALKKMAVEKSSFLFLGFQTAILGIGYIFFLRNDSIGQIGFLVMILFSRIGLYGFSLGEMQIRQTMIEASVRGEVNGFSNALTALATIGLFGAGVILPSTDDFKYLVFTSVVFVFVAVLIYGLWYQKQKMEKFKNYL